MGKAGERGSPGIPGLPGAKVRKQNFIPTSTQFRDFSEGKVCPDYQGERAYKVNLVFKVKLELLVRKVQLVSLVESVLLVTQVCKVQPVPLDGLVNVVSEEKKEKP